MVAIAGSLQISHSAYADQYDDQINAIRGQVNQYQAKASELHAKADSLQVALETLTAEKNAIQAQLDLSQAKFDKLTNDIAVNKKKLADNQDALGAIIADLYIDGKVSPLEMLASSKNVGEYMDKHEYQSSVSQRLDETIGVVKTLKVQLEKDQKAVELVLSDQKIQKEAKVAKETEQQQLVAQTKGEENAYHELTAQKNGEINKLRSQQAAAIQSRASSSGYKSLGGDPNRGGYPAQWMNASMSSCSSDPWGMCKRQCVSYTAFKVDQTYGNMPFWGGHGNANQWGNNARAAGIPVSATPKAGTVGVQYSGAYGHVAWVESVNADGSLTISQFNANWSGDFSRWVVDRSFFNEYIYFGG
ncbi:MAG TPA: CHAP domain-containing protein [Candidatus Saccharimonadales bacterium]|nr:CHAP domain-containing protein [Candidatus Saccharimonadales bacterium]